jgi:hypothetical protein
MAEATEHKYFSLEIYLTVLAVLFTMWALVHLFGYLMGPSTTTTTK